MAAAEGRKVVSRSCQDFGDLKMTPNWVALNVHFICEKYNSNELW